MSIATLPRLPTTARIWGTVTASDGATVRIAGLSGLAALGDDIVIGHGPEAVPGEIIALDDTAATAFLMDTSTGLCAGDRAWLRPGGRARPGDHWLGKVVDAYGETPDGERLEPGPRSEQSAHGTGARRPLGPRLKTGLGALDTMLPLCRGQRLGVFAGSGVGKSRLVMDLACGVAADIVVIGLIGERSREVSDLHRMLQAAGAMDRTVIISATSDQSALVKRRASDLTMATAAHFRRQGAHVLCLFDSVTRFAEAHREIALAAGEPPALRAFPPSTAPAIAALCERAGPGREGEPGGDVTAVFTVLVAGSDMEEPVSDMVRGVLDGHVVLDRTIAERGRFPAIDLRRSVSRSAPDAWSAAEEQVAAEARRLLAAYEDAAPMIQAGLYAPGADPLLDRAVELWPALDGFVGSKSPDRSDRENFAALAGILGIEMVDEDTPANAADPMAMSGDGPRQEPATPTFETADDDFAPLGGSALGGSPRDAAPVGDLGPTSEPVGATPGFTGTSQELDGHEVPLEDGVGLAPLGGAPDIDEGLSNLGGDLPELGGDLPDLGGDLPDLGGDLPRLEDGLPEVGGGLPDLGGELHDLGGGLPDLGNGLPDLGSPSDGGDDETPERGAVGLDALPELPEPANSGGVVPLPGADAEPGFSVDALPDLPSPANSPGDLPDLGTLPDLPDLPDLGPPEGGGLPDLPDLPSLEPSPDGDLPVLSDLLKDGPGPLPKLPRDE